jgi:hypothetical protein
MNYLLPHRSQHFPFSGAAADGARTTPPVVMGLPPKGSVGGGVAVGAGVAGAGGDEIVPSAGPPAKSSTKASFPMKFKAKMPGQDMSQHFKFLQSWTMHKKYYKVGLGFRV